MSKKRVRTKPQADNEYYKFEKGKRYVFSRRRFVERNNKYGAYAYSYNDSIRWIRQVQGIVFTVNHDLGVCDDNPTVNGFGIARSWCTEIK